MKGCWKTASLHLSALNNGCMKSDTVAQRILSLGDWYPLLAPIQVQEVLFLILLLAHVQGKQQRMT